MAYIKSSGFGVTGTNVTDYETFEVMFSKLLWEIDPHYSKFQARCKSFPKIVEDNFLNFNRPQDHGHKVKNISSLSVASKVNEPKKYLDRTFMTISSMNKLHDIVHSVVEKISEYFDILREQRERTMLKIHNKRLPPMKIRV